MKHSKDMWTEIQKKDTTLTHVEFDKTRTTHRNMIRNYANSETFKFNRTKNSENHDHSNSENDNDHHPDEGSEDEDENEHKNEHEFESQLTEMTDGNPPHQIYTEQARANPITATSTAPTNWVQGENLQVEI